MTGVLKQINRSNGGMPKRAVSQPVMVDVEGVEGDRHLNPRYHGGQKKAVLMIAAEIVDDLAARGFPVYYGALGENLTVFGLDPLGWRSGQRYRIGEDVVIELTTLRTPCGSLDVYGPEIKDELYGSPPKWAHGGFYARVIHPGLLVEGAPVSLESDQA